MTSATDNATAAGALAHTANGAGDLRLHSLVEHLHEVARLAADHAAPFGGQDWAHLAGLWHDLGKYRPRFQRYIRAASGFEAENAHIEGERRQSTPLHRGRTAGLRALRDAGPGAGLSDRRPPCRALRLALGVRVASQRASTPRRAAPSCRKPGRGGRRPDSRPWRFQRRTCATSPAARQASPVAADAVLLLWWMPISSTPKPSWTPARPAAAATGRTLATLRDGLRRPHGRRSRRRRRTPRSTACARDVLASAAPRPADAPGLFSLTVPTGGGKTLATHGLRPRPRPAHGQRRDHLRHPLHQHHRADGGRLPRHLRRGRDRAPQQRRGRPRTREPRSRLACENWDAPIVVTTNVQFFESLFAARTSPLPQAAQHRRTASSSSTRRSSCRRNSCNRSWTC